MNAAQVIEEIKQLPPEEQDKVLAFAKCMPNAKTREAMDEANHPEKLEHFEDAADLFRIGSHSEIFS